MWQATDTALRTDLLLESGLGLKSGLEAILAGLGVKGLGLGLGLCWFVTRHIFMPK